jgi:hypothetical protein
MAAGGGADVVDGGADGVWPGSSRLTGRWRMSPRRLPWRRRGRKCARPDIQPAIYRGTPLERPLRKLNRRGLVPRGSQPRHVRINVKIVERGKVGASAADGIGAEGIEAEEIAGAVIAVQRVEPTAAPIVAGMAAEVGMRRALEATTGRMLCGKDLHRVDRVRQQAERGSLT